MARGAQIHDGKAAMPQRDACRAVDPGAVIIRAAMSDGSCHLQDERFGVVVADAARKGLGLPADQHFYVSQEVRDYFAAHKKRLKRGYSKWRKTYEAWRAANADKAALLDSRNDKISAAALSEKIPAFPLDAKLATRAAGKDVLQPVAAALPLLISGSADLHGSTLNYIAADKDFDKTNRAGRNLRYGIREHAMAAISNGVAYDGIFRPSCATFLVFADYSRPSMRLAALSKLPVIYIYTHDSIGVGEDGPTHQPVETVSGLRVIPNLDVIRPADPEETAGAFAAALERHDGPTLLALSRQVRLFGVGLRADRHIFPGRHRERAGDEPGNACYQNLTALRV